MKCQVIESFKVSSSKGVLEFQPGQEVILPEEIALKMIAESRIVSLEKGAYRGYSDIVKSHIWIAKDKSELEALRASENISEPAYTTEELKMLEGLDKDALEVIKNVKKIFELATLEEVIRVDSGK